MTNLTEAAERLRQRIKDIPCEHLGSVGYFNGHNAARHAAAEIVAETFAELAGDDAEPSGDEPWLRRVGFLPDGDDDKPHDFGLRIWDTNETDDYGKHPAMQIVVSTLDNSIWLETYGTGGESLCLVELPGTTKGDVRRLAAALGIDMKEGAGK